MRSFAVIWFLAAICVYCAAKPTSLSVLQKKAENSPTEFEELVKANGYPAETHKVQTDDGYMLTVHRIPYGRKCGADQPRKGSVLVQHGLLCSSFDWIVMGPEKGLAYILADNCYDVWLGNSRGNTYSKAHAWLDVKSKEFWDFSWHQMGDLDIPTVTRLILHKTGEKSIDYIGHSQGTTQFLIFASLHPEMAGSYKTMYALAPVAFMKHLVSPIVQVLSEWEKWLQTGIDIIGWKEFMPKSEFLEKIGEALCVDEHPFMQSMCSNVLFLLCGFDSTELNATMLPVIVQHTPAGASTHQLLHYAQGVKSDHFRQYDYGVVENLIRYKQIHPPDYDLSQIRVNMSLHYSENDWMSSVEDVERLMKSVNKKYLVNTHKVEFSKFNHLDYMWAIHADSLLYSHIIEMMDETSKQKKT